ncbi:GNAT family N-acetyltransferase [Candidatus Woesearchaeota archaeon]|nr:GNAT family N-acetyltransferase [Candidatus Woesearchaeota archaeon]
MEIRGYRDEDYGKVKELLMATDMYAEGVDTKDALGRKIKFSPDSIIAAEENGKIAGVIYLTIDPWITFLHHLAVHPDFEGKGVGTALIEEAENIAKKANAKWAALMVETKKAEARKFYEKKGWKTVNTNNLMFKEIK